MSEVTEGEQHAPATIDEIPVNESASDLAPFQYTPLSAPTSQIRLLRIPRKVSQTTEHLVVHMFDAPLNQNPRYVALSYMWGNPAMTEAIELNGHRYHITESAFVMLQALQLDDDDMVVWIDAICINQQDDIEKTSQVQLMRQVYTSAKEVIIWLGLSTPSTDITLQEIRKFGKQLLEMGIWDLTDENCNAWELDRKNTSKAAQMKNALIDLFEDHNMRQILGEHVFWWLMPDIGERGWFRRIWCIQECANAEVATFRCGKEQVEFTVYWAVYSYLYMFATYALSHLTGDDLTDRRMLRLVSKICATFPREIPGISREKLIGRQLDLRGLLYTCNVTSKSGIRIECTDPRDRVFALLGLVTDAAAKEIVADYTLSLEEAYVATARALLNNGHDDILSLCRSGTLRHNLPSWVPDWSSMPRNPWSVGRTECFFTAGFRSSSNPTPPRIYIAPSAYPNELHLDGIVIDTIKDLGTIWTLGFDLDYSYVAVVATAVFDDITTYLSQSPKYTASEKEEAAWRIPIGDVEWCGMDVQRAISNGPAKTGVEALKHYAKHHSAGTMADSEYVNENSRVMHLAGVMMQGKHDSRPYLSQTGWVGLCPMQGVPGDSIVLFDGARVPYVIRKEDGGGRWKLIGECHVYGIMDGEYMKENPVFERIVLC